MPPIQLLIKPASGSCNLRCEYCFYHDEMENRETKNYGFMSIDTLEAIVKKTLDYAEVSCGFAFQGGEPTLVGVDFYRQLLILQKKYNKKGISITNSIQTNGYQIDEEWAKFLADNKFLVGLSLDGTKYTNNTYRINPKGEGSFDNIMKTVELFNRFHVEYNILTVVNRRTAEKISKIYSFYEKNNWKYLQFIACLDPIGETPGGREYSLTPELYGEFFVQLFDLWYMDLQKGKQPYIRQFENYISILMGYHPEACDQRGICSIQYVVEGDGSVYPCDFYVLDEYRLGSFMEDTIDDMKKRGGEIRFVETSLENKEECESCEYYHVCRGGCRRHREVHDNGTLGINYFCPSYKRFFAHALPRMQQIAMELSRI